MNAHTHEHACPCILNTRATHTHNNIGEFCHHLLSSHYKSGCALGRYPDISKIINTTTLIKSEHELASHVSFYQSHYRFIFVMCQSTLIHLSSFLCDLLVNMNSEWDFKPWCGDLLSWKHYLSLLSLLSFAAIQFEVSSLSDSLPSL